jgi:hypothetical protein
MAILIKFKAKMDYTSTDDRSKSWPNGEPKTVRKAAASKEGK